MGKLEKLQQLLADYDQGVLHNDVSKLMELRDKEIVLYGAGNIGKKLFKILKDNNFNIICFLDKNRDIDKSVYEVPVYHPEDFEGSKNEIHVILSALFSKNTYEEVREYLNALNFKMIYALQELNFSSLNDGIFYNYLCPAKSQSDLNNLDKGKILKAFSLFEEDKDRELYISYVKAHLSMDFTKFNEPYDVSMQYLAHDIEENINYTRYIDCGGYDGDTVRNLIKNEKHIEKLAVFEPQNDLCEKIYEYAKGQDFKEVNIFPCGVRERAEKLRFNVDNGAKATSKVSETGEEVIQCTSIDSSLYGFKPTFIKMDIEGSEKSALKGAKNTIIENHPQLAICVYHSLSDIWEIPLLINEIYDGYKFYLRSYNYMGLETVLYAFPHVEV